MQTQILQARILNGCNFWLADRNDLELGTHMNIQKKLQKITQYSIFRIHSGRYFFLFIFWKKDLLTNTWHSFSLIFLSNTLATTIMVLFMLPNIYVTKCDHRSFLIICKALYHSVHHSKIHFHARVIFSICRNLAILL